MVSRMSILFVLLTLLAACGGQPTAEAPEPTDATDAAAIEEEAATEEFAATEDECEEGFRAIENEQITNGRVCVPQAPERIAVLDFNQTSLLLTLDIEPVAYSNRWQEMLLVANPELETQIENALADARDVGDPTAPSLEGLAATDPDMILALDYTPASYDDLNAIAPTIMYEGANMDWRELTLLTGEAVRRSDDVDRLIAGYDARVAKLTETIEAMGEPPTLATIGFYAGAAEPYLLMDNFAYQDLLREVGVALVPVAGMSSEEIMAEYGGPVLPLALERLDLIDADRLIVVIDTADGAADYERLQEEPVWQVLSAVEAEQVYARGNYWYSANPYDLHKVLDDLFQIIGDVDPAEVSPNPFLDE